MTWCSKPVRFAAGRTVGRFAVTGSGWRANGRRNKRRHWGAGSRVTALLLRIQLTSGLGGFLISRSCRWLACGLGCVGSRPGGHRAHATRGSWRSGCWHAGPVPWRFRRTCIYAWLLDWSRRSCGGHSHSKTLVHVVFIGLVIAPPTETSNDVARDLVEHLEWAVVLVTRRS